MRGLIKTVIYYCIGLFIAGLAYLTVGHQYIHGPGLHHILILLTFIGGAIWTALSIGKYFIENKTEELKIIIFSNLVIIISFVGLVYYVIKKDMDKYQNKPSSEDTVWTEQKGDTTTIYHNENIVYYKIKDSVYLNFIDSTKLKFK